MWALFVIAGLDFLGASLVCPLPDSHERQADCPWAAIARSAASEDEAGAARVIERLQPTLWAGMGLDGARSDLHAAWGESRNFDENAHAEIIAAPVLAALAGRLGVAGKDPHVHAGVQHTYGYLFSTLWTPFGYKRARWLDGELERGLGLPAGTLRPTPTKGTLYANVTCLLARATASAMGLEHTCATTAAPAIVAWSPPPHPRLEETSGAVTLRSDWLPLAGAKRSLFVYSVATPGRAPRLLTSFPVDAAFVDALRDPKGLGEDQPIVVRYNASVPGLKGRGRRRLVSVP